VVIGIIGLLMSILLPALSRAREQARNIKCQSNIRTLVQAMFIYANDNRGTLPIPGIYGHVFPYYGVITAQVGTYDYSDDGGRLMRYVGRSPDVRQAIFLCPSDEPPRIAGNPDLQPDPSHFRNFSYNFNANLLGRAMGRASREADYYVGVRITEVRQSAHKFLVYEQNAPRDATALGAIGNPDGGGPNPILFLLSTRHLGRCNIGFADGHAEQVEPRSIIPPGLNTAHVARSYEELLYDGY